MTYSVSGSPGDDMDPELDPEHSLVGPSNADEALTADTYSVHEPPWWASRYVRASPAGDKN